MKLRSLLGAVLVAAVVAASAAWAGTGVTPRTVWLCAPGLAHDPCTSSLAATRIAADGSITAVTAKAATRSRFDCFYVYPTVSRELSANADLRVQQTEIDTAVAQASRFSQVCRVYAPIYRQITVLGIAVHPDLRLPRAEAQVAYTSLRAGFEDYLAHDNHNRPIVFIGHSQGAAILINLLAHEVDRNAALRRRLLLAIVLGGDVEVKTGALDGGSFAHIPLCSRLGETGCVIAYSSFPHEPPASSLFGRVGQGVALQWGSSGSKSLQVACVNPAALGGGNGTLDPFMPAGGSARTPWLEYPGLYTARCESAGGATWLQVGKATGSSDTRPTVMESLGPNWGYHVYDVNLALGNLVADVAAAERSWPHTSGVVRRGSGARRRATPARARRSDRPVRVRRSRAAARSSR